ncbi:hypothetical protein COU96_01440 [Candidatus Shapirobacteria bacterium CG10_big_fil_rev_8_21_14_0_10_38_14]|uniref:Uncharacterized protein n=1 Tax=Candidatus Shapirobacteria bacterium CG10_big_fil_rev_8_21_14_0_10_38_14 TaxID=1974483 RepID=A0A2M8L5K0_9BACT|nr:MAG: hypothetical protein COU96_01440 [Candidatus Shapirobacteria bacterium CG10_big_fil_rev_8_21_14_0_10_38_14]
MKENETNFRPEINTALEKYQILLDFYSLPQVVQNIAWGSILESLETDPQGTIREIDGYWKETFGSNDKNKKDPTETNEENSTGAKPDLQKILYESRRKQWGEYIKRTKRT